MSLSEMPSVLATSCHGPASGVWLGAHNSELAVGEMRHAQFCGSSGGACEKKWIGICALDHLRGILQLRIGIAVIA